MDDKDYVFARFKDDKPASADRRETLTIPRRAGASGSRSVEVVHVRSGSAARDRTQRPDLHVRAASWEGGFPTKQAPRAAAPIEPVSPEAAQPVTHLMPAWEPAATEADAARAEARIAAPRRGRDRAGQHPVGQPASAPAATAQADDPATPPRRGRGRPPRQPGSPPTRRVADPFDAADDGANCIRCGYAIDPARDGRERMTCLACG